MAPKASKEKEKHKKKFLRLQQLDVVEYEEEEEESEEESLEKQKQTQIRNIHSKPKDNGWIDSDTESDSESESESSLADYKLQPIIKPSTNTTQLKRHPSTSPVLSPTRSIKKLKNEPKSQVKTPKSTRFWSNEDEITILKGMYDFKNIKGKDLISDFEEFYDWVKGKVQINFQKPQLRSKIRNMKMRFDNAIKRCEDDSDPVFSRPHEVLAFEHAKKIWGKSRNGIKETNAKEDTSIRIVHVNKKEKAEEEGDFLSKFPFLKKSFDDDKSFTSLGLGKFVKDNIRFIGIEKAKELDQSYKQLFADEMEFNYKKASFLRNQVKK